jgi:hypothetical protein
MPTTTIRKMNDYDPNIFSKSFNDQGWEKPIELYQRYLKEQADGDRVSLIAEVDGEFAGYINVLWHSYNPVCKEEDIPEISDFNVLIKYQRQGSKLMDRAEEIIKGGSI